MDTSPAPPPAPNGTVVHLLGPSTGGIGSHVAEVSRQLTRLGWQTVVAGPAGVMDGHRLDEAGVEQIAVGTTATWSPRRLRSLRRAVRCSIERAALVHAHGVRAAAVLRTIRDTPPVMLTLHNEMDGTYHGWRARVFGRLERHLLRHADGVVFVSEASAEAHRREVPDRRRTVMMSFAAPAVAARDRSTVRAEAGLSPDTPLVVVVARLHPQKDLDTFLHAMHRVCERIPAARAVVAGSGPELDHLRAIRAELGLDTVVQFVGAVSPVADLLAAADVVAVTSRWESGPIVAVEALQVGAALVLTDVGAVAEVVRRHGGAVLCPPGDAASIAGALIDLLLDRERCHELAAQGRRLAERHFDAGDAARRLTTAYHDVITRTQVRDAPRPT